MSEQLDKQVSLLRILSRSLENFKKFGRHNYTPARIRSRISSLKEVWNQCIQGHAVLLQIYPEEEREVINYFHDDQLDVYSEIYQTTLDLMTEWLEEMEPCVSPNRSLEQSFVRFESSALSVKHLPPIKLPPFSGEFSEWENFRDRFKALIIDNKELSDFSRMHFLASSLTGAARDVLASIPVTANNFSVAWKALLARFENKRKLIDTHIATLYNLDPIARESAAELHALRDRAERSISALKCLGRSSEEMLSDIMVYFVAQKLDPSTRRAWKLKCSTESTPLIFEDLIKFISSRALALEELAPLSVKLNRSVKVNFATTSDTSEPTCPLCKKSHYFNKCPQFLNKSPSQRRDLVQQYKRCFNCLSQKHSSRECQSKFSCRICQQKHHSSLHVDSPSLCAPTKNSANENRYTNVKNEVMADAPGIVHSANISAPSQAIAMSSVSLNVAAVPSPVLLATAKVIVESDTGRKLTVRVLLDQGSEVTFITESLAQLLRVSRSRTLTTISAVGGSNAGTCRHTALVKISARDQSGPTFSATAFILKSLTQYKPRSSQGVENWRYLSDLHLADDDPTGSDPIDIIIGAELYSIIILDGVRKGPIGQPIAQNSYLGWLISGPAESPSARAHHVNVLHCSLEDELRRFWEIEEVPSRKILCPDEQRCEAHFVSTHSRDSSGRYIVRLPFKDGPPINIGESRSIAIKRLNTLIHRFNSSHELKKEYSEFIVEYETLNHMIKIPPSLSLNTQIVYIPHHPVIRASSSTTRLRVVFNASSLTANGTSLNSHLHQGTKLQTDLVAVLMKWRQHKYVYTADIAKMYRQILVDPRDRDYQRIVWLNKDSPTVHNYQLQTVTYGTAAAPFLALRVLKQLVIDEGDAFPLASSVLKDNIYVDDVLFGAEDMPLLRRSRDQICALLAKGGFILRKWASNKSELLADIPSENHGLACNRIIQIDDNVSILGISWNPALDAFQFGVSLTDPLPSTKRTVLSAIAKLFDSFGWVTPATITAKIFMQKLWRIKLDWDDALPPLLINQWEKIYKNLFHLNGLQISRWTGRDSDTACCELHGFADASTVAYAAVIYIRVISLSGDTTTQLLAGKSKVAPLKTISVPRLELCAATLLARLMEFTRESLNLKGENYYCWTDSTVVLAWLQSHPSRWKTFVSNRVADIQTRLPDAHWLHVPTRDNPADCASRGFLGSELKSFPLWWQGPQWLRLKTNQWPLQNSSAAPDVSEETKSACSHVARSVEPWDLTSRYSSWPKLIKVTAYIIRFVTRCRSGCSKSKRTESHSLALSASECRLAKFTLIRTVQSDVLAAELKALRQNYPLPPKSVITSLSPFLDENGIVRVGGRLHQAPFSFEKRHPILLAAHPAVKLIARHVHVKSCHSGVQLTLATLRQEYWILKARTVVKHIIHKCVVCTREKASIPEQLMGQLPQSRISAPSRVFVHCGVDYVGPFATQASFGRGAKSHKSYIALFICLASCAIHLELVSNYSTSAFLDAFSRFCSRRGLLAVMYSDNGTTFVGAIKEIRQAYRDSITDPNFLNQLAADQISWKFIPPHAPHFGGLWEAGVRSLKHLRRVLGSHTLTFEEFTTLLCRIEACLNSRPIGPLNDTLDDYEPLTPGHFLIGSALTLKPEPSVLRISENRLTRWQLVHQMTERFWKIWQADYVNTLQQKVKWRKEQPPVKIGTMVLIRNPLLPPCKWELGKVTQCHAGPDGLVRVVTVRTALSEYKRPLVKLCILPVEEVPPTDDA